jgi:hypothetical protein
LHRVAAFRADAPKLVRAVLRREEVQVRAVMRPARATRVERLVGDALRLAAGDGYRPDAVPALVRVVVGLTHGERDRLAVGRQLRIADALHHDQVVHVERMRRRLRGPGQRDAERRGRIDFMGNLA